jgi:hypothetical protein
MMLLAEIVVLVGWKAIDLKVFGVNTLKAVVQFL